MVHNDCCIAYLTPQRITITVDTAYCRTSSAFGISADQQTEVKVRDTILRLSGLYFPPPGPGGSLGSRNDRRIITHVLKAMPIERLIDYTGSVNASPYRKAYISL